MQQSNSLQVMLCDATCELIYLHIPIYIYIYVSIYICIYRHRRICIHILSPGALKYGSWPKKTAAVKGGGLTSSRARAAGGAKLPARLLGGTKALPAEGLAGASSRSFFCKGT